MAVLKAARTAQYLKWAEFQFSVTDTMVDTAGASKAFSAAAAVFDVINLPPAAVVVAGEVVVETASNEGGAGTHTIAVGDSTTANRYLAATSIKTAARTALVPTGYRSTGQNLRITLAASVGDATAGKVTVRVGYVIPGCANEAVPA